MLCCFIVSCGGGSKSATDNTQGTDTPEVVEQPADPFVNLTLQSKVEQVQPMTGIVFWDTHDAWNSTEKTVLADAISLEYSYISIDQIVKGEDEYDWTYLDDKLTKIAARNHQAIFRFYYTYPGRHTTVPDYIKNLPDYNETEGTSEGLTTYFPDWSHAELQAFTQEFHSNFAQRYDNDNRIAFLQLGFGLWGEYHIYDGPDRLGDTFPSKAYQKTFLTHLESVYSNLSWSISIDASDTQKTPMNEAEVINLSFGLFDDSFMHQDHSGYNESAWNFFNYNERYKTVPFGGEFSYVEDTDQLNVLKPDVGAYGISYEEFADKFHISYMIGNDTYHGGLSEEQPISRIKEASMASGYEFTITAFSANSTQIKVTIKNTGVAPIYYDAFVVIDEIKSIESLKGLLPNSSQEFIIDRNTEKTNDSLNVTIVSDHILSSQTIEFNADL